jgi:hypothetical protein
MMETLSSDVVEVDDYWEWADLVHRKGWSDGLPVAPPTESRVRQMIEYLDRDPADVIARIAPGFGVATIEQIAIQATMAGCVPEHMPVVVAAVDALTDPAFNLYGIQSTTNAAAPLAVVNGPIVDRLGFNVEMNAFGGNGFANAAIGRAIKLILWNIGEGKPTITDMATLGQPAKFTFCVAENRARTPWRELHTDFGFRDEESAVTVFACNGPVPAVVNGSAIRMLGTLGEGFATTTVMAYHAAGDLLVVLAPKPAQALAAAGYSKEDVRRHFVEYCRLSVKRLKDCHALDQPLTDQSMIYWGHVGLADVRAKLEELGDDDTVPLLQSPEHVRIMVTGADNGWWGAYLPGWGNYGSTFVTRRIDSKE